MIEDRYTRRGATAPNAKLSTAQAREYRRRFQEENPRPTIKSLAEEARVSYTAMWKLLTGQSYTESQSG